LRAWLTRPTRYLVRYDCVTFLSFLETLRHTEGALGEVWVMLDEAHAVFQLAKRRVYRVASVAADSVPSEEVGPPPPPPPPVAAAAAAAIETSPGAAARRARSPTPAVDAAPTDPAGRVLLRHESGAAVLEPVLEECPKWTQLRGILAEIAEANAQRALRPQQVGTGGD
jgi:DNA excision repair protein ERCC-4